jgi:hypothetical protein
MTLLEMRELVADVQEILEDRLPGVSPGDAGAAANAALQHLLDEGAVEIEGYEDGG